MTDTSNTEGVFRLIESVPSPKAESFKLWLAKLGREEKDNVFVSSKGIDKMIDYYLAKGYTLEWIEVRVKAILDRKKSTHPFATLISVARFFRATHFPHQLIFFLNHSNNF